MRHAMLTLVATVLVAGCQASPPAPTSVAAPAPVMSPQPAPTPTLPTFVNRVWRTRAAPPQYYVFLGDGTLVIASTAGTPMVGRWRRTANGLTMVEEGREYAADIVSLTEEALHVRSHNPGAPVDLHLVPADSTSEVAAADAALPATVTGTVAYRERMALPPDAEVEIWITDTSPGLVTMAILAQSTVPTAGAQVPIPFTVAIDPARVEPSHRYGLRALIKSGGRTLFETREPVPVLTQGAPAALSLLLTRSRD